MRYSYVVIDTIKTERLAYYTWCETGPVDQKPGVDTNRIGKIILGPPP